MSHWDNDCLNMKMNHVQPSSFMVNHGPTTHCNEECLNMKINHGQPWSNFALWQWLPQNENQSWLMIINSHGHIPTTIVSWSNVTLSQACSSMVNHGWPWSNVALWQILSIWKSSMVNHGPMSHYEKYSINMKINHGPTSHCDKYCLNMKINHDQPCFFYGL